MKITRVEYQVEHDKPVLYVFQRVDGQRVLTKVTDFVPYFYIPEEEKDKLEGLHITGPFLSSRGDSVMKVDTNLPADVGQLREVYSRTWEADVLFPNRYLIDEVDTLEPCSPKVMFIDIETDNSGRVPDPMTAPEPITCTTIFVDDTYVTFVFRDNVTAGVRSNIFKDSLHEINYFTNEVDMLKAMLNFIHEQEPDILSGWNSNFFDLPYIINRAKRLGLNYQLLSPMGVVFIEDKKDFTGTYEIKIKGVSVIDLMDAYKKFSQGQEVSYALDYIAQKIADVGKTAHGNEVAWLWRRDLDHLIEYNTNDCFLLASIDRKLLLLDYLDELRRLCYCNFEDCLVVTKMADSYILRLFHGKKIFPTKKKQQRVEFEGAIVNAFGKGVYKNVAVFDVKSLYPSIIVSANLSLDTLMPNGTEPDENSILVNKVTVRTDIVGFLPEVINTLFLERSKYKKLMKQEEFDSQGYKVFDMRQRAVKTLLNALYGQTAYPGSRLYDARIAETVTWMGRQLITWAQNFMEELDFRVLYMDTDSLHWLLGLDDLDVDFIESICYCLNKSFDKFAEQYHLKRHVFEMNFEKVYRKVFYGAKKKRYAGWICYKDGQYLEKRDVWGFEIKRSDASEFSKKMQERLFDMLLKEDKTKDDIMRYLRDEIHRLRTGKFKFSEIGMPKGMSKEPLDYLRGEFDPSKPAWKQKGLSANIRGALYAMKELGIDLSSKPKMIYVSKVPAPLPPIDVLCFDEDSNIPPGTEINIEVMLEKLVKNKVQLIFEALGWSLKELSYHWKGNLPSEGEQTELFAVEDVGEKSKLIFVPLELEPDCDLPF